MNWMTSAKKRIYKSKRQREQQQRLSAQYKIFQSSLSTENIYKLQAGNIQHQHRNHHKDTANHKRSIFLANARNENMDGNHTSIGVCAIKMIRNLFQERNPRASPTLANHHSRKPQQEQYNPLDELVHSPLEKMNQLENDVETAFESFQSINASNLNTNHKSLVNQLEDVISSSHSDRSILYIDNGKIINCNPNRKSSPSNSFCESDNCFQWETDAKFELPLPADTSIFKDAKLQKKIGIQKRDANLAIKVSSKDPSSERILQKIPQTWDLFEGDYSFPEPSFSKQKSIQSLYLQGKQIDIDGELEVSDFMN